MLKFDYCRTESNHFFFSKEKHQFIKKIFLKTESFYAWVRGTISWPLFILKILLLLYTSPKSTTVHIYIREGKGSTESLEQEERRIKYIRNLCVLGLRIHNCSDFISLCLKFLSQSFISQFSKVLLSFTWAQNRNITFSPSQASL